MTRHPMPIAFEFWRIPGRKQLIHDGKRLVLVARWPGCCLRLALAPGLEDGMAYALRHPRLRHALRALSHARVRAGRIGRGHGCHACGSGPSRPTPAALLELHTLQALDATLAGASLREVAEGLFGADAVAADWYNDGGLRCPRAPPGASWRCADAWRLSPPGTASAALQRRDVSRPPQNVPEQAASLS